MSPLLVLLPGLDGSGRLFAPLVEACAGRVDTQVVCFPAREPLDYDALTTRVLDELPEGRPYLLLGESFSGPLALRLASRRPPGLGGVVLCATFLRSPIGRWLGMGPWPWLFRIEPPLALIDFLLTGGDRALSRQVREVIGGVSEETLLTRVRAILEVDARADLDDCQLPLLYLQARRDRLVPARCGREIVSQKPRATVVALDGPHLLLQTRPSEALEAIDEMLAAAQSPNAS